MWAPRGGEERVAQRGRSNVKKRKGKKEPTHRKQGKGFKKKNPPSVGRGGTVDRAGEKKREIEIYMFPNSRKKKEEDTWQDRRKTGEEEGAYRARGRENHSGEHFAPTY